MNDALRMDEWTSLITNFKEDFQRKIKIFKNKEIDLMIQSIQDRPWEEMKNNEKIGEESKQVNEAKSNKLFIGCIEIRNEEEFYRSILTKLVLEGRKYQTHFWDQFKEPIQRLELDIQINSNEEAKEIKEIHDEVDQVLKTFNPHARRNNFFRVNSIDRRKFRENASFIYEQLFVKGIDPWKIARHLGMKPKVFEKHLSFFTKPRANKIKRFIEKQENKTKTDEEIAVELKIFI